MGMRALAIDAEAVERRGMRRGKIAVGAAAGRGVDEVEADLGGERLGVLVKRGARIALFVRRAVEFADTLTLTPSVRDFRPRIFGTSSSASAIVGTRMSTSA